MQVNLDQLLQSPDQAAAFFDGIPFQDPARVCTNLGRMAATTIPSALLTEVLAQVKQCLPDISDPDMAINNLERYFAAARSPLALASLIERDPTAVPVLLTIFSTSQYLTDELIRDPSSYDALRLAAGQPVARDILIDELDLALSVLEETEIDAAMTVIRRFKHRETLRIAYGDIIGNQPLETVTEQISHLADAICSATLTFCKRKVSSRHGQPTTRSGEPVSVTVIAMGKLGGKELNYSSDIDLVFFYSADGLTDGDRQIGNRDYFDRVGQLFVKLLTETTPLGIAYRVDMRLRPGGKKAPLTGSFDNALGYYELRGRTWERQALVKARPVAGDKQLGERLLKQLESWIYARRLSVAEINGIKSLKRQIERRAAGEGDATNVKTGHGGIRDIEFAIQFLQLLHGGELPSVRTGNTLDAISRLHLANCLNSQEKKLLDTGYRWLRLLEHRLQIMFDLQTHTLPENQEEWIRIARRMEISGDSPSDVLLRFRRKLATTTQHNRAILDHLLHNAFSDSETDDGGREADLVLDPFIGEEVVEEILRQYGFKNPLAAHRHLTLLATERNRFLSPRRCRHFLAAIARSLLEEISRTPNPDETLLSLTRVSDSLGGKAAIWELFSVHPPSLRLYVHLGATCEYLCNILTRNPGLIDDLTDALVIHELPTLQDLQQRLRRLTFGATDIDPILHSFKDAHHLRVGIRDITGQDEIQKTHPCLSHVAEVCIAEVVKHEQEKMTERFGQPVTQEGQPLFLEVLGLGKLGGEEPNYHSDLDVVFLYDSDGAGFSGAARDSTSHHDYFSRVAANVTRRLSASGPYGRLYEVDSRLRPTGKSGTLVVSTHEFQRYFKEGDGQLWERLAMCKARPLATAGPPSPALQQLIYDSVTASPWQRGFTDEIAQMRLRMQEGASPRNIKRGTGGTVDVEFAIQMLQLKFAASHPDVLVPNTIVAAQALWKQSLLSTDDFEFFRKSYRMLRWVEARIRLMNTSARHDLPEPGPDFEKLAFLLDYQDPQQLRNEIDFLRRENRRRFNALIEVHGSG